VFPPRFDPETAEGSISIQFQRKAASGAEKVPVLKTDGTPRLGRGGEPMFRAVAAKPFGWAEAVVGSTQLRIRPAANPDGSPILQRDGKPARNLYDVFLPVRTASRGEPTVIKVRAKIHRPIPEDATIKWAHVARRVIGSQVRWELQFDLDRPEWPVTPSLRSRPDSGMVAVALGWRKIDGDLRVGYWVGDDGRSGEILIPEAHLSRWKVCDNLRSIRDINFNTSREALVAWLKIQDSLSDEFKTQVESVELWKSPGRLAKLLNWWRENRVPGDDVIFETLEGRKVAVGDERRPNGKPVYQYTGGVKQDRHLHDWEAFSRLGGTRWRKNHYLTTAIGLAKEYAHVVTADIDWHELGYNPPIEDSDQVVNKTNRGIAAVAMLRDALHNYLTPVEVSPKNIAIACNHCEKKGKASGRWVKCAIHGKIDRAENAARNLLARGMAAVQVPVG
jgi:hypothetical protein